jgi:hypothetical protein
VTGVSIAMGLLVVLNQLRIPFYPYYPRVTHTVLLSDSYDLYFLLAASVCVPWTLFLLRKLPKSELAGSLAVWAAGACLASLGIPYGAPILYAAVIFTALLNVIVVAVSIRS